MIYLQIQFETFSPTQFEAFSPLEILSSSHIIRFFYSGMQLSLLNALKDLGELFNS